MPDIDIQIGEKEPDINIVITGEEVPETTPGEPKPQAQISLNIRKMLDGSLVLFDHPDIDIVIMPHMLKIVTFPKDDMGDHVYAAQSRLFTFLTKKGIIVFDSVQGGNIYGSLEANLPPPIFDKVDPVQVAIFVIGKFIHEELPHYSRDEKYQDEVEKWLLEPDDDYTTSLDDAAKWHRPRKGVQNRWPGSTAAYGLTGMYRA